ncbi:MAG: hypothetical protein KAS19_13075, partial [Anaerolineales bacterium]|nr:hypothetical protein [Anaerolineales bacterium]
AKVKTALNEVGLTEQDAEDILQLISLGTFQERFVIPETHRESKTSVDPRSMDEKRGSIGFGPKKKEFLGRQF